MEKEFISFEQALELKKLGFDEPCLAKYINKQFSMNVAGEWYKHNSNEITNGWISAPLYQQVFKWFREKYKLHQYIKQYQGEHFFFHIEDMVHPRRFDEYTVEMLRVFNEYTSQEEAELGCLNKLIDIQIKKVI